MVPRWPQAPKLTQNGSEIHSKCCDQRFCHFLIEKGVADPSHGRQTHVASKIQGPFVFEKNSLEHTSTSQALGASKNPRGVFVGETRTEACNSDVKGFPKSRDHASEEENRLEQACQTLGASKNLEAFVAAKAQDAPALLRGSACRHWLRRWNAFLAVAGMRAFANTLLYGTASNTEVFECTAPQLGQHLGLEPHMEELGVSRLGPR